MNAPDKHRPALFAVEIRTAGWDGLVAWYRDVLGLEVLLRVMDDRYALLGVGAARLAILGRDEPGLATGRWSLAFEVKDLETTSGRLAAAGIQAPVPLDNPEGFREIVVSDPDGNRIRIFAWADSHP